VVQITIEVPKKLNEKQKQILRDFAATEEAQLRQTRKSFMEKLKGIFSGESGG
jgi:molecular chaperone DnaJ